MKRLKITSFQNVDDKFLIGNFLSKNLLPFSNDLNKLILDFVGFNPKTRKELQKALKLWCRNKIKALEKYGHISSWNVQNVTSFHDLFDHKECWAESFNEDISYWDVRNVKDMSFTFANLKNFNKDIGNWNTSKVTNMDSMFYQAELFNQNLHTKKITRNYKSYIAWDVSKVKSMKWMFFACEDFNGNISNWNTSSLKEIECMFKEAHTFNQNIDTKIKIINNEQYIAWNVSYITDMNYLFERAYSFNTTIKNWNVLNVINMEGMFSSSGYNQPLSNWDVRNVNNMSNMFGDCHEFNQDISNWNVENVKDFGFMFYNALSFNHNLDKWNIENSPFKSTYKMFDECESLEEYPSWYIKE